jgi:hypothetical protein
MSCSNLPTHVNFRNCLQWPYDKGVLIYNDKVVFQDTVLRRILDLRQLYKKSKFRPTSGHEGQEGQWRYRSPHSLTSALDGVGSKGYEPAALPPVPIVQKAGLAPGLAWTGAENLVPTRMLSPNLPAGSGSVYRLHYPDRL